MSAGLHRFLVSWVSLFFAGGISPLGQTGAAISKYFDHGSIYENLQLQWFLTGQLEWAQLHGVHGLSIPARACCGGKQRPRHPVVSDRCLLAPFRRAPQAHSTSTSRWTASSPPPIGDILRFLAHFN